MLESLKESVTCQLYLVGPNRFLRSKVNQQAFITGDFILFFSPAFTFCLICQLDQNSRPAPGRNLIQVLSLDYSWLCRTTESDRNVNSADCNSSLFRYAVGRVWLVTRLKGILLSHFQLSHRNELMTPSSHRSLWKPLMSLLPVCLFGSSVT